MYVILGQITKAKKKRKKKKKGEGLKEKKGGEDRMGLYPNKKQKTKLAIRY